ncbi:MAG: methyltransferase domain-containing protein [Actinomycetota bacterium]
MSDALVTANYDRGALAPRIAEGFAAAGTDIDGISVDDLAVVDEFHTGSRAATEHVMAALGVAEGLRVLDVGCGIGGPARYCAAHLGATVDGVDLTPSYVEAARTLTDWVGLGDRARFHVGDGGSLGFDDATFDRAYLLHVGMNVADKAALFAELSRVVRPGGRVAVYDLMATGAPGPAFPVPWARDPGASFLATPEHYAEALDGAGFTDVTSENRREHVLEFMTAAAQQAAKAEGPPPVGLHLLMGDDAGQRLANMVASLRAGAISPVLLVATRP